MSNASVNELDSGPALPPNGAPDSLRAGFAPAPEAGRRRVSADSFRLLTARLKNGSHAAEAVVQPVIPEIFPEIIIAPQPVDVVQPVETLVAASLPEEPQVLPEVEAPPPAIAEFPVFDAPEMPAVAAEPDLAEPEIVPFEDAVPLDVGEQIAEAEPLHAAEVAEEPAPAVETIDVDSAPEELDAVQPYTGFDPIEVDPESLPSLPEFRPLSWSPESEADAKDLGTETADLPPPVMEEAVAASAVSLPEIEWPAAPDDAYPVQAEESVPVEEAAAPEPQAEAPPALSAAPETFGKSFVQHDPVDRPSAASMLPSMPPPASPMAEKVVDAMLKTISTAIYAKPSAADRASFLRDVAAVMEQEREEEAAASAPAEPPPPVPVPSRLAPSIAAQHPILPPPQPVVLAPVAAPPFVPVVVTPVFVAPARIVEAPVAEPVIVPVEASTAAPVEAESVLADEPEEDAEPEPIAEVIAHRIGPVSSLLKTRNEEPDPFADPAKSAPVLEVPDEESGELALTLLDMMSGSAGTALPHERALASDTLLRILPRIPLKQMIAVVERVAIMEQPPALLVAKLIRDPRLEVVGPLLERCSQISEQDLMNAAPTGDVAKLRMMARRRTLSSVLSDYLISSGEPQVLLTLIRNPGVALSHGAFYRLAEHAGQHHALLAPLTTRADLPAPVAFELFWHVPPELRRFIFSRFLTDSENLNKILRITLSTHGGDGEQPQGEPRFPPREQIDQALQKAAAFKLEEAAQQLGEIGGIGRDAALRILSDREGEPLSVLLKALGYPRTQLIDALELLRTPEAGILRPDRNPDELQTIFDSLSFNKARILLTYWDWFTRKSGPYAPSN